jgi:predicted O-methyltransferase YrrM
VNARRGAVRLRRSVPGAPLGAALVIALLSAGAASPARQEGGRKDPALDARVKAFLDRTRGQWRDLNVPYEDGQALFDLVTKKGFKRGLEIGTSTGLSAVWIGWAMSRTGGRLVTIEIDERRHLEAKKNLEAAGVLAFVDARRDDAHALVKTLEGPFDFVFSDADKDWYPQYFKDVDPKLSPGGCFTAHNVASPWGGIAEFLDLVRARADYRTEILNASRAGLSVSCKVR